MKQDISVKRVMIVPNPKGGVQKAKVPEEDRARPCLDDSALTKLLHYALILERHFHWPQDIEWAIDYLGNIYLLQTRPLAVAKIEPEPQIDLSEYPILLRGGKVSCGGIGAGRVFRYKTEHDLAICPEGVVLVAGRTSPRFVKIMDKVRAIVTNLGSPTDHMSCLAREFQVPTIVDTREATKKLLLDPNSPSFSPENCSTLHDIIRFAHETALNAIFSVGEKTNLKKKGRSYRLISDIPLPIYVIDIQGNIVEAPKENSVPPQSIKCEIFQALWDGLTHKSIPWKALSPGSLDIKGFFSAMTQTMIDTLASEQQMGENYVILAENYINASFRFGYHFATVDVYVCENIHDNYVSFTFKGGAAPEPRRARRVKLIKTILSNLDFTVNAKGDFLKARIMYAPKEQCLEKVEMLGRLLGCTRYLDMALTSDSLVNECVERFEKGDYSLGIFDHYVPSHSHRDQEPVPR